MDNSNNNKGKKKNNIFARIGGVVIGLVIAVVVGFGKGVLEGILEYGLESGITGIGSSIEEAVYSDTIVGVWKAEEKDTEKNRLNLLKAISLSDKEIELCKKIEYKYVVIQEYNDDGTYKVYYDIEKTKENVKKFYEKVNDKLYENRKSLHDFYLETYNIKIKDMSKNEFNIAVAKLYSKDNYKKMIEYFVNNAYDYEKLENVENGTYTMKKDQIYRTKEGEYTPVYIGYTLENDDTLTLDYLDGAITYKRVK